METKAHHVAVGLVAVVVIAAAFGFVVWLAKTEIDREFALYDIYFEGGVSGLSEAAKVSLNGITVGAVTGIHFVEERPDSVRVRIRVKAGTPVRENTVATTRLQGVTGVSIVSLSGGAADSPLVAPEPGEIPVIASGKSQVARLFASAPELLERATVLVERANEMLNLENRKSISGLLGNLERLTRNAADSAGNFDKLMQSAETISIEMTDVAHKVNAIVDDAQSLTRNFNATAVAAKKTLITADRVLDSFDTAMKGDLVRLIDETRMLIGTLDRVVQRIESDPARFFFGDQSEGYRPQ